MIAPLSVVAPPTVMSKPLRAVIPDCSLTDSKLPRSFDWLKPTEPLPLLTPVTGPLPLGPWLRLRLACRPKLVCLDWKVDVSCWLSIVRLPAPILTVPASSVAPRSVRSLGVMIRAVPPADSVVSTLMTSLELLLPLPRLRLATGVMVAIYLIRVRTH